MSKRLYVIFNSDETLSVHDIERRINLRFAGLAKVNEDDVDLEGKWCGYISRPANFYEFPDFPYWNMFLWCYWDTLLNGIELRNYIMKILETLDVSEWWYIEETSISLYDELDTIEFSKVLANALGIEDFQQPRYFPSEDSNHVFRDSRDRVKSLFA